MTSTNEILSSAHDAIRTIRPTIAPVNDNAFPGASSYCPEDHETPNLSAFFRVEHGYRDYDIYWPEILDIEAKAIFARLNIRPSEIQPRSYKAFTRPMFGKFDIMTARVTPSAYKKLKSEGLTTLKLHID